MNRLLAFVIVLFIQNVAMGEVFDSIFVIAGRAPSSHNAQMWKCRKIAPDACTISINDSLCLPQIDPDNRESWISIGTFVENCVLAASDLGYTLGVYKSPQKVLLKIEGKKEPENRYIPLIKKRHTLRVPFEKEPVDSTLLQYTNCRYISRLSSKGQEMADNIYQANEQQMADKNKTKELADWMITSRKELKNRKDGLSPAMLGIHGLKKDFFLLFFNKRSIQKPLFAKQCLSTVKKQIDHCSGFLVLFSKVGSSEDDWFNAGRELETIWLDLTRKNIAVHPMSQSIEELNFNQDLKSLLHDDRDIQMVLRIGRVQSSSRDVPCSKRREIMLSR